MSRKVSLSDDVFAYLNSLAIASGAKPGEILNEAILQLYAPPWLEPDHDKLLLAEMNKRRRKEVATLSSAFFACEMFEKRIVACALYDLKRLGNIDMLKVKYYITAWKTFYTGLPRSFSIALANDDAHISALSNAAFLLDYVSDLEKAKAAIHTAAKAASMRRSATLRGIEQERIRQDRETSITGR